MLRVSGVTTDGVVLNTAVLERHLAEHGLTRTQINVLLCPNDKQDVTLMYKLLSAIANLRAPLPSDAPIFSANRRILSLLGSLYVHLLDPYTNTTLSLHQQLTHLSAAAHLLLALYAKYRGAFIPVQLYHDTMAMIKNAFFCVAKTQIDDPEGLFWLILLCSDELEKLFGRVRSITGTDSNCNQLQLTHRLDNGVQCNTILAAHPDWVRGPRRLAFQNVIEQGHEATQKSDHINPISWVGDIKVKNVILKSCWIEGRQRAEADLRAADIESPFASMEASRNVDIFRPFGDGKMVMVDGPIADSEQEETEITDAVENIPNKPMTPISNSDEHSGGPDLEDLASVEVAAEDNEDIRDSAWLLMSKDSKRRHHKASVMKEYSNIRQSGPESRDRLKRVMGYSRHMHQIPSSISGGGFIFDEDTPVVNIEDPGLTLVRCNDRIFLAVITIVGLYQGTNALSSIPADAVNEPNIRIRVQIMCLRLVPFEGHPEQGDWEWTGRSALLAPARYVSDIEGRWFRPYNASVAISSREKTIGDTTYRFSSKELVVAGAFLFAQIHEDIDRLPNVTESPSFPYITSSGMHQILSHSSLTKKTNISGAVCFLCEDQNASQGARRKQHRCSKCPTLAISLSSATELVRHISRHILFDDDIDLDENPCGFCLNTGICTIYLRKTKGRKGVLKVDMARSQCVNKVDLSFKHASKVTATSPCTNQPLACPLCPNGAPAVWKYNLKSHILKVHRGADGSRYEDLYDISDNERVLMRRIYQEKSSAKSRSTKRKRKAALADRPISVSESHIIRTITGYVSCQLSTCMLRLRSLILDPSLQMRLIPVPHLKRIKCPLTLPQALAILMVSEDRHVADGRIRRVPLPKIMPCMNFLIVRQVTRRMSRYSQAALVRRPSLAQTGQIQKIQIRMMAQIWKLFRPMKWVFNY